MAEEKKPCTAVEALRDVVRSLTEVVERLTRLVEEQQKEIDHLRQKTDPQVYINRYDFRYKDPLYDWSLGSDDVSDTSIPVKVNDGDN